MKRTIILLAALFFMNSAFSQKKQQAKDPVDSTKGTNIPKALNAGMDLMSWEIFFRNIDRLASMGGRAVPSDILFATRDTVLAYQNAVARQLSLQIDTTKKKK